MMRKLIWRSSAAAFVPVLAGLLATPFLGLEGWWSLAAGATVAAVAFGAFLEVARAATAWSGPKNFVTVALPVAALLAIGFLGAVCMDLLSQKLLRPETFVSGLLAGTVFSQVALLVSSQRLASIRQ